jgi:glycosyltransferase involved in cell wall biosynthesis
VFLLAVLEQPPTAGALAAASSICQGVDWVVMRQDHGWQRWQAWAHHIARGHPLATWDYCPTAMREKLHTLVQREAVQVVQIEHSFLAPYAQGLRRAGCRVVLDFHNFGQAQYRTMLHMQCGRVERLSWIAKALLMRGWEARLVAQVDCCLAASPVDARAIAHAAGRPVELLTNGVDTSALNVLAPATGHRLLFVGHLRYPPNRDAVAWLVRDILPLVRREIADVHLTVVGDGGGHPAVAVPGVEFVGQTDEVIPHYASAQVALAPLRAGGGTRLKILEAMALGRPVVSTALGCQGLSVTPDQDILVADTAADLAAAIIRLLRKEDLRIRLAERARALVVREYDWGAIGNQLLAVYDRLAVAAPRGGC